MMGNAVTEEYIRRSEALDAIRRFSTGNGSVLGYHSGAIDLAMEAIEAIPAVDVTQVVQGNGKLRATEEAETTQIIDGCCTACGEFMDCCEAADYKFCPYCAKRIV